MKTNLDFIESMFTSKTNIYKNQKYLKSNFDDNIWSISLEGDNFNIDFNIKLSDGFCLLDNVQLMNTVKFWILANTLPESGISYSDSAINYRIKYVISVFDYINLKFGKEIKISKYGFKLLNENHLKQLIHDISKNKLKTESIYDLSQKLSEYLLEKIKDISLPTVIKNNLFLKNDLAVQNMKLTDEQLLLVRAFLYKENLYRKDKNGKLKPNLTNIYKEIYEGNCLAGNKVFITLCPSELTLSIDNGTFQKEKRSIYEIDRDFDILSETNIPNYKNAIKSMGKLNHLDFNNEQLLTPNSSVFEIVKNIVPSTKPSQRFKTVPSDIVFKTIKKAIDFHFEYGDDIVKSYQNIVKYMTENKLSNFYKIPKDDLKLLLTDKFKLQVKEWRNVQGGGLKRFEELRNNRSFYFVLRAYYGATQFVTGSIMARRQSEMISLRANDSIDHINKVLIFKRSKSTKNIFGVKDTIELPVDEIALEMISNIEKIQNTLINYGILNENTNLFLPIMYNNPLAIPKSLNVSLYNDSLDVFYDYVEVECENNKRYYMRQHQLRRFFAMAFFWGNGFGSMDTLRWFLGHTDVKHLYHYITESTEGSVLKSVKSQYVYETLDNQEDLKSLLRKKYGINNVNLIEREVLEDYIEELMDEKRLDVEPEFITDDKGQSYKILVKVKGL
jgi:hypothetical protein